MTEAEVGIPRTTEHRRQVVVDSERGRSGHEHRSVSRGDSPAASAAAGAVIPNKSLVIWTGRSGVLGQTPQIYAWTGDGRQLGAGSPPGRTTPADDLPAPWQQYLSSRAARLDRRSLHDAPTESGAGGRAVVVGAAPPSSTGHGGVAPSARRRCGDGADHDPESLAAIAGWAKIPAD